MIAFDTDVLTGILRGNAAYIERVSKMPDEHGIPVVVVEEILRGRLNTIRQAEPGRAKVTLERAYELFAEAVNDLRFLQILHYESDCDVLFNQWRKQKIRVSTRDLRIAAICVSRRATLISCNRRDFAQVPGLDVEFWD
ncbi:MAG: type II toxin-antitoxin system VapC family toxin [Planctomycetota bacterium]|jgi:tRNA(fMet)-specific endonuclease VapC|nr:type II toxin-antitoxin system VapC family toxin [Planctomycetota bacterium]